MTKHPVTNEPAMLAKALELVLERTKRAGSAYANGTRAKPAGDILRETGVLMLPGTQSARQVVSAIVRAISFSSPDSMRPEDVANIRRRWAECVDESAIAIVVWG